MKLVAEKSTAATAIHGREELEQRRARVMNDLETVQDYFEYKQEQGLRNARFVRSEQWDPAEIEAHQRQQRHPFVFNEILDKVNSVCGQQVQTRLDVHALPVEAEDIPVAELESRRIKWTEQINKLEQTESAVFYDGVVKIIGAVQVYWDDSDLEYGFPHVEKIPFNELYWDLNCRDAELEKKARWMARVARVSRLDALEDFPEFADAIMNAGSKYGYGYRDIGTLTELEEFMRTRGHLGLQSDRDEVQIIQHFERVKVYQYVVGDLVRGDSKVFDNKRESERFYQGLQDAYNEAGETLIDENGAPLLHWGMYEKDVIVHTLVIGDQCVQCKPTALPVHPYIVYFPYFDDGVSWAFVDQLIDPQILINRFFAQLDHQLGVMAKGSHTVMPALLWHEFDMENLREEFSMTGALIPVNDHNAIKPIENPTPAPELFNGIMWSIGRLQEYAGGRNVLGLGQNAQESGKAVIARQEQGNVSRLPMFDNLRDWRRRVTELFTWYNRNFMAAGQAMRISGPEGEYSYIRLEDNDMDTLRELRMDIHVDEAGRSETMRERYFEHIKELLQTTQAPPEVAARYLLEFSTLPQKIKRELGRAMEEYQEYIAQKAAVQKEEKLQDDIDTAMRRKQLREKAEAEHEQADAEGERQQLAEHLSGLSPGQRIEALSNMNGREALRAAAGASLMANA